MLTILLSLCQYHWQFHSTCTNRWSQTRPVQTTKPTRGLSGRPMTHPMQANKTYPAVKCTFSWPSSSHSSLPCSYAFSDVQVFLLCVWMQAATFASCSQATVTESQRPLKFRYILHGLYLIKFVKIIKTGDEKKKPQTQRQTLYLLLLFLYLSNCWLLSCSCEISTYPGIIIINRIRLDGLIYSLKTSLQLNMCQELQIFAFV